MGGTDDPSNLVELTVEEHALAHKALWEEHGNEYDRIAWMGLSKMITNQEAIRQTQVQSGKQKPSEETRKKMSEVKKGKTSPNFLKMQKWLKEHQNNPSYAKLISEANSQTWILKHQDGRTVTVAHLQSFCEENNLSRNMLYSICKGRKKSHRGWIEVTKITSSHNRP
jgi:hypothetical protein